MTEQTPEDFDLDAWLSGASRPTRSVQIFQRGDMLATLDELARKIELAEAVGDEGRSMAQKSPAVLRQKYAELSAEFAATALDVRVRASTADEEREIIAGRGKGQADEVNRDLVHAALVFPKMTRAQFDVLVDRIGEFQWGRLKDAYTAVTTEEPQPSADFLPLSSTPDDSV